MIVDEFFAIIGIDAAQAKRKTLTQNTQGFDDTRLSFAENGDAVGPARKNVGDIERIEEIAGAAIATVGDQVHFQKTRFPDLAESRTNRNHGFEQLPGASGGIESAF